MKFQKLTTNKLFYGKWPYKIRCKVNHIHLTRFHSYDSINSFSSLKGFLGTSPKYINSPFELERLKEFVSIIKNYKEEVKTRIEHSNIDIYVEDKDLYIELQNKLHKFIYNVTEPSSDEELQTLLQSKKYIICNNLPRGKYKFKITFKDMPENVRLNLITWAEKYKNDEIFINKRTVEHFKLHKNRYGSHFFYVKDSGVRTLLLIAASGYIQKIDEYIPRKALDAA